MNNKGFTLIELLATIALLAVISVISFVSISATLEESKVKDCENLLSSIKSAAKEYVADNRYNVTGTATSEQMNGHSIIVSGTDRYIEIDAGVLISQKYLSSEITDDTGAVMIDNPFDDTNIAPTDVKIRIYLNDDYTIYTGKYDLHDSVVVKNVSETEVNCSNKRW